MKGQVRAMILLPAAAPGADSVELPGLKRRVITLPGGYCYLSAT